MSRRRILLRATSLIVVFIAVFVAAQIDKHTGSHLNNWVRGFEDDPPWWFHALALAGTLVWFVAGLSAVARWRRKHQKEGG